MKNKTARKILVDLRIVDELRTEAKELEREIKRKKARLIKVLTRIEDVEDITDVVNGVALSVSKMRTVYGQDTSIETVGTASDRYATVYTNANDRKLCGLQLHDYDGQNNSHREFFYGSGWTSRSKAEQAALDWCVYGIKPQYDGKVPETT